MRPQASGFSSGFYFLNASILLVISATEAGSLLLRASGSNCDQIRLAS